MRAAVEERSFRIIRSPARMVGVLTGLTACLAVVGMLGVRLNLTSSMPVGMYQVLDEASVLKHGDIVLACLPERVATLAHARGYVPGGGRCPAGTAPIGKFVMALPGDTVSVEPSGLSVNGAEIRRSRPLKHDRSGRPLPHLPSGRSVVTAHSIWLIGSSSHSFDSRYFGPLPAANVLVRVRPF